MNNMTPQQMQQLAQALKKMAGMCNNPGMGMGMPKAMMDAKMLAQLMQALKNGRLTMCMGNGKNPVSAARGRARASAAAATQPKP